MIKKVFVLFIAIFLFTSCSTLNTVLQEKENGKGSRVVYDVNFEDAYMLSKKSFRWAGV